LAGLALSGAAAPAGARGTGGGDSAHWAGLVQGHSTGATAHVTSSASPSQATVFFAQGAPEAVELWIDGVDAGSFGAESTQGLYYFEAPVPAGSTNAQLYPSGKGPNTSAPLASTAAVLSPGADYSLISYIDSTGQTELSFLSFGNQANQLRSGRLILRHTADYGPVDIYLNGTKVASDLADDPADQPEADLVVPAGPAALKVTAAGQPGTVLAQQTIPVLPAEVSDLELVGAPASGSTPSSLNLLGMYQVLPTGYWEVTRSGRVYTMGSATAYGSITRPLNAPVVAMTPSPDAGGYYLVTADGGVFSFGDAAFYGSLPGIGIHVRDIVALIMDANGDGYWLIGADGGVFSFGGATFGGSLPAQRVRVDDIVGGAANAYYGGGYWLLGANGSVYPLGGAVAYGSPSHLAHPAVAMVATSDGLGYWIFAADGGVFTYGSAQFLGSGADQHRSAPVVAATVSDDQQGYQLMDSQGGVFNFGNSQFEGVAGPGLASPVVGAAAP
jgi:hypothetical protein